MSYRPIPVEEIFACLSVEEQAAIVVRGNELLEQYRSSRAACDVEGLSDEAPKESNAMRQRRV